jgi:NAD-dependent deacetylase
MHSLAYASGDNEKLIQQAKRWLESAGCVAAVTGAGVSAESGIPTFRGKDGLWRNFRAEELATPAAFQRDPLTVWQWYQWRRGLIAACQPNAGHFALARLEQRKADYLLITQNVDGLHEQAGSRKVCRLHGSIWLVRCIDCGKEREERGAFAELPPRCTCGGLLRPGVVWFGENLPAAVWREAEAFMQRCEVLLVVGTSSAVYPAASLAPLAKQCGARIIEINLERTGLSARADAVLSGPSGQILEELIG